jgi:hypothetical protein
LIRINPALQRIPRVAFQPSRPGNYRIRKEPAEHCTSTIEAVAEVLGQLEGDPERLRGMLRPFDAMVDRQIEFAQNRQGPSRHRIRKKPYVPPAQRIARELADVLPRAVLVYAESNAALQADGDRAHELIHLVASRPSTGERFEALMRPGAALNETTHDHVELPAEEILAGEDRAQAMTRWRDFLREDDVLTGWGWFTLGLARDNSPERELLDLREKTIDVLKRRPGGLEEATIALGGQGAKEGRGRAGRRLNALEVVLSRLLIG